VRNLSWRNGKQIFLLENDLARRPKERDRLILGVFGSPDVWHTDGLRGADPLTSKIAYIGPKKVIVAEFPVKDGEFVSLGHVSIDGEIASQARE
jgi:methylitaconate Delta-isomerase